MAKTQFLRHKHDTSSRIPRRRTWKKQKTTTCSKQTHPQEYLIAEDLAAKAGNVPLAALSLFMGLTGGMDWGDMSGPMMEHVGFHNII